MSEEKFIGRRLFNYCILIGIISGVGAILFTLVLNFFNAVFLSLAGIEVPHIPGEPPIFSYNFGFNIPIFIITAIGCFIAGLIVHKIAPEAQGDGTNAALRSFHHLKGIIKLRISFVKILASAITIGSGGSAGREGPITQIGASLGSFLGTVLKLSDKERRILLLCGIAGGVGSVFKAPLGGALFAIEVLYKRDFETKAIVPAFISSIVAYVIFILAMDFIAGIHAPSIFDVPEVKMSFQEFPFYIFLSIISAIIGIFYIKFFYSTENFFKKLKISPYLKPLIGGFLTGVIGFFLPSVLGTSYGYVQEAIYGNLALSFIILTIFGKIIATSFTVCSGGSGGVFGPSVVIGGLIGAGLATFLSQYFSDIQISTYVVLGMASFIAGVCKTPLAAILMTSEITRGYELLPALMVVSAISYILTKDFTIYKEQVPTQFDSPAHRMDLAIDILQNIKVKDAMTPSPITLSPEDNIEKVIHLIETTGHHGYPVIENERLVGIITFSDAEKVPVEQRKKVKVKDVMTKKVIVTYPEEDLRSALIKMLSLEEYSTLRIGRLPVVQDGKLVGILTKGDIIRAYAKERRRVFK